MARGSTLLRTGGTLLKRHGPIALPLLAVGIFLRVWHLQPVFLFGDEAEYAIVAKYLAQDWTYLAYPAIEQLGVTPFVSQPPLVLYLMGLAMRIFGMTDLVAISVSVVLGSLTVLVFYAIGAALHGRVMGGLSGLFLAVLPMHVSMSRKAFLDAGLVLFMGLTILFAILWVQTRRKGWAIATGVAAGAATLSKLPGVLILAVLGLYLLYELGVHAFQWLAKKRTEAREETLRTLRHAGYALIPIAAFGLAYLGLILHLQALFDLYIKLMWQLGRVETSLANVQEITEMYRPWHWYFTDPEHGLPVQLGAPLWWLSLAGAAVAAIDLAVRPARNRDRLLVLLFPAVTLAFFLWSDRKEAFYMLPTASGLMVLAAYGPARLIQAIRAWAVRRRDISWTRAASGVTLMVVLLLSAMPALANTQHAAMKHQQVEGIFGYGVKEAALHIEEEDPDATQIGGLLGRWTLHFYNGQTTYHWYVPHDQIEREIEAGEVRYLVLDTYLDLPHENSYFRYLVDKYNGQVVKTWTKDPAWGTTQLIEFHPDASGNGGGASAGGNMTAPAG